MSTDLATYEEQDRLPASPADQVRAVMGGLKAIRTFIDGELKPKIDFGTIPGCGDKPTLFLPGAQKTVMYFNAFPTYRVKTLDLGNGHAEFQVRTILIGRAGNQQIGEGIGSASTKEKKFSKGRGGAGMPACPSCSKPLRKSKDKPEYFCWRKEDGCGAVFAQDHPKIKSAKPAEVSDDAAYESRNTVLKMAKKRSLVDAALTLGCLGEMFTQDIEDTYDLAALPEPRREIIEGEVVEPEVIGQPHGAKGVYSKTSLHPRNTGHGVGEFLPPEKDRALEDWIKKCLEVVAKDWEGLWSAQMDKGVGLPKECLNPPLNFFQLTGHLMKWVRESDWIDPHQIRTDDGLKIRYLSLVYHLSADSRAAMRLEVRGYVARQIALKRDSIYRKYPDLAPDGWLEQQEEARREAEAEDSEGDDRDPIPAAAMETVDDDPDEDIPLQVAGKGDAYEPPAETPTAKRSRM